MLRLGVHGHRRRRHAHHHPAETTGKEIPIFTGTQQLHVTAGVAHGVWRYWEATRDREFLRDAGVEILPRRRASGPAAARAASATFTSAASSGRTSITTR
jgi:hypothetical protein